MVPRLLSLTATLACLPVFAQVIVIHDRFPRIPTPIRADCRIQSVDVRADVQDQAARVRVTQVFQNPSSFPMEAKAIFPLPEAAAVSGITLMADGKEIPGRILSREEARRIYEDIVRSRRDPALLEYMGHGLFETSVFPVPPGGVSTVEIRYSELLKRDSGLIDFVLPLGTSKHSAKPADHVSVTVNIAAAGSIKTVYSPTHDVAISRPDAEHATARLDLHHVTVSDDLRLLYATDSNPVGVNVLSYKPEANEDGYFVMLATPEMRTPQSAKLPKTMIFVVDRSGSMSGDKIRQVKSALHYLLNQLDKADTFNLVAYDSEVESFRPELQRADESSIRAASAWVDGINAGGGTNIDGALRAGLSMLKDTSRPNYVVFLTDGQPTSGERNELKITSNAATANAVHARMFAFGVGFDVNGRLLDRLARELRGQTTYVRPNENIEAPVSALWAKIGSPLMTEVAVNIGLDNGATSRLYPRTMPDLFRGDQLVLVGRYRQGGPAAIRLSGSAAGNKQTLTYHANFVTHSSDDTNAFVARLWATRRIGEIIDELDLHGQNRELVDELVALSTKFGILTPYTSFLADDRVNLSARAANEVNVMASTAQLALADGVGGFDQRVLKSQFRGATNAAAAPPPAPSVQQALRNTGDKTFFKKQNVWQDSTVTPEQMNRAIRIVQFSREYFDLAAANGGKMAQYLAVDGPVLVNLGANTYRIEPDAK